MSSLNADGGADDGAARAPILDLIGMVREVLSEAKVDEICGELLAETSAEFGSKSREVLTLRIHIERWLATGEDYKSGISEWDSMLLRMVRDACGASTDFPDWSDIQGVFSYLREDESRAEQIISLSQALLPEIVAEFGRAHEFAVEISHEIYFWLNEFVESEYGLLTAERVEEPEDFERLENAVEHYRQTDGPEAERTLQFAQLLFREYLHLGRKRDAAQLAAKYNLNIE